MMKIEKISTLVKEAISENNSLFLIDLLFSQGNEIKVVVDGDNGVPLKECIRISRHIEGNLDREEEDYSLEVTTPDISEPIKNTRQYQKNINRILNVKYGEEVIEGKLTEVLENEISLEWKTREPKPIGKGKVTVNKKVTLPINKIKEAKVKIIFN